VKKSQVKAFAKDYAKAAKVRFVSKKGISRFLSWLLRRASGKWAKMLPELADNMRPCIVRFGRRVYIILPSSPGEGSLPLAQQIEIMVHEVAHAFRIVDWVEKGGSVSEWYKEYFKNPAFRAVEEGLPCAAEAEIRYALYGKVPKPPNLDSYYLFQENIADAHRAYAANIDKVRELGRGGSTFEASSIAIKLMKKHDIL